MSTEFWEQQDDARNTAWAITRFATMNKFELHLERARMEKEIERLDEETEESRARMAELQRQIDELELSRLPFQEGNRRTELDRKGGLSNL